MTTGENLLTNLRLKVNSPNSGNLTTTKANEYFKEALINTIEKLYQSLEGTKKYDELKTYIKIDAIFTPSNNLSNGQYSNKLFLNGASTPLISDYMHLLVCSIKYRQALPFTITDASNASPIKITIKEQNNLRSTDYQAPYPETYYISGITGNTNANGVCYIKKINPNQALLYSDTLLTVPKVGNGIFGINSVPILSKEYYRMATSYPSIEKGALMSNPTFMFPAYSFGQSGITFSPTFVPALEVTMDYISNAIQLIDTADTTVDLEAYYPLKLLYLFLDNAALLYGESVRDNNLVSIESNQIAKNP